MKMHLQSSLLGPRRHLLLLATPEVTPRQPTNTLENQGKKLGLPISKSIRWHLVERIKQEIADGTYDTDAKLVLAMDRFLDQYGIGRSIPLKYSMGSKTLNFIV